MKKQNIFFYLSLLCSVAIIVLMFLPWLSITDKLGNTESVSLIPGTIMQLIEGQSLKVEGSLDALIFLVPVFAGMIIVQVLFIVTAFRPDKEVVFPGTVSLLLAGLGMIIFFFVTDVAFKLITVTNKVYTDDFLTFIAFDSWTWVPIAWFLIALVQKIVFIRLAFGKKKEKES